MAIELHLSGVVEPALEEASAALLRAVSAGELERRKVAGAGDAPKRGDPLALAALVLAVPGAILATLDLAERARVAERVRGLLDKLRGSDTNATLEVDGEPPLELASASEDQVMDLLAKHP